MNDKYILPQAAQDTLGGIKAAEVGDKYTQECRIDKETGKLYTRSADSFLIEDIFEGNPVMSSSCREGNISLIEGYGKSTQFTTQGNQLFDINVYEGKSSAGAEATVDNGVIKIIGTPTKDTWVQSDRISIEDFKKYFKVGGLSIKPHKSSGCNFDFGIYINSTTVKENNSPYEITEEIYNNYSGNAYYFIELKSSSSPSGYIQPMVYQTGSGEYEPYTGGAPSPSPDYSQEIKSPVVTGIKITDGAEKEQSIALSAPITLRGIPSESGNITINGQKFLSDYIGQKDGMYRITRFFGVYEVTGTEEFLIGSVAQYEKTTYNRYFNATALNLNLSAWSWKSTPGLCNILIYNTGIWDKEGQIGFCFNRNQIHIRLSYPTIGVSEEATSEEKEQAYINYLKGLYDSGRPLKILYPLENPTFEPLPAEDAQALASLKTFYPTSIISWETEDNSGAWTRAEIKCDLKSYILEKIQEIKNNSIAQIQNINSNFIR